jgi:hypothetical protein
MLKRKNPVKIALLTLGIPIGAFGCFFLWILLNLPIYTDSDWLYEHQSRFFEGYKGDRLVGGGHYFPLDGRDLWIRFRVLIPAEGIPHENSCTSSELKTVSNWFADNAVNQKLFFWPDDFAADRAILKRTDLICRMGLITNRFGEFPRECGSWSIYDPKTRYYYLRYDCYN